ncbi:MAG TPA: hypothetical protein DCW42_02465 [Bacteroidetes bacterium]|nr:hypothetical protein [Bacteroidota bacterium]
MLRIDEIIETFRYIARIMSGKYYHSNFINRNDIFDAVANLLLDFLEGNSREWDPMSHFPVSSALTI